MSAIVWPKTARGWRALFWLTIHRCPIHKSRLRIDTTVYDLGGPGYCFKCRGIGMWPRSGRDALEQNARAVAQKEPQP